MMKITVLILPLLLFIRCSTYEENPPLVYNNNGNKEGTTVVILQSGVQVEKRDNQYIYLGDLVLSPMQLQGLDQYGDIFAFKSKSTYKGEFKPEYGIVPYGLGLESEKQLKEDSSTNLVAHLSGSHWAMVRFTFDSSLSTLQIAAIEQAMNELQELTNVRFYNATDEPTGNPNLGVEYNYITFYSSNVNNSQIGSVGGQQTINLVSFNSKTIMHEILHALGLFHEQCRPDRDTYIDVNYANITNENRHNFDRVTQNYLTLGAFDFNSIMLYDSYAFSSNGEPTLVKKDGSLFYDNYQLSDLDRSYVNSYYIPYKSNPSGTRVLIDDQVYKSDNSIMTPLERDNLERKLNGEPPIWDGTGKPPMQ